MAKYVVKSETTAEQYMSEVIGPKIETIEESIDSLKEDQGTVLNAVKDSNDSLKAEFEKMKATKAQGRQIVYFEKGNVETSIRENIKSALDDNLVQRKIKVETTATANIAEDELSLIKAMTNAFLIWTESNKKLNEAYEKSRRPLIRINFTKKWLMVMAIALLAFTLFAIGNVHYDVHQTPQSWANRNYEAGVELDEENPGAAYHEIMVDFKNGYVAEARQKVSDREIAAKARIKKKRRYERKLSKYLSNVDSLGVTVTDFIERMDADGRVESLVFFKNQVDESVAYIMSDGTVAVTFDASINSIEKARASMRKEIWRYIGEISEPYMLNRK